MNNLNNKKEIRTDEYLKKAIQELKKDFIEMSSELDKVDLYTNLVDYKKIFHLTIEQGHCFILWHIADQQVLRIESAYNHIYLSRQLNKDKNLTHNGYPKDSWYLSSYTGLFNKPEKISDENMSTKVEVANYYFKNIESKYPDKSIPLDLKDYQDLIKVAKEVKKKQ